MFVYVGQSVCLSVYLSVFLSICGRPVCLYVFDYLCQSVPKNLYYKENVFWWFDSLLLFVFYLLLFYLLFSLNAVTANISTIIQWSMNKCL